MIITPDAVELFVASKWHIKHKDSRELYERTFREHFGVQPEMVAFLWNTLHAQNLDGDADFEKLLWMLYFFKQCPTEIVGAHFCQCNRNTYREHIWKMAWKVSHLKIVSFDKPSCVKITDI